MKEKQKIKGTAGSNLKSDKPKAKLFSEKKTLSPETKKRRLILGFIIGAIGFLLYSNTFHHGYVLDDFSAIKENNIVRQGTEAIPEIFKTSYRQGYLSIKDGLYRPLSLATFAIEWEFFPDQPGVSHFTNVILYALTGFLLFLMLCKFFQAFHESDKRNEAIAFIASLLFISHPIHTEVVANIKSRDEILCFLFVIASFIFVFKYSETGKKKFVLYGMITYFLSLLSKETSITFLALLPLSLYLFVKITMKKNAAITLCFSGAAAFYLIIRGNVLDGAMADDSVSVADNFIIGAKDFGTKMASAFYVLGKYLQLHVFPYPLSYDYSFNQIPIVTFSNLFSIGSLIIYIFLGAIAGWILLKSIKNKPDEKPIRNESKIISFGILFYLITIFLFSNLVLTIGTSLGERLMYFPSLGFCICTAALIVKYLKIESVKFETGNWKLYPVVAALILFSYKTYSRNADWKDNYTLYAHDVHIVPNSTKAHYYLGLELIKIEAEKVKDAVRKNKIYEEGISELEKAVAIMPNFASAYTQMGVAYYRMKNYQKAIENYEKASKLRPMDAITLNNVGTVYFEWGKYKEAEEKFSEAVRVDVRYVDGYMNLGSVYGTVKEFEKSIAAFQQAIKYAPDNARAHFFLGITYENMGDKTNAQKFFQLAQQLDPKMKK